MPMTIVAKKKVMIFEKKLVCKYFKILKKKFWNFISDKWSDWTDIDTECELNATTNEYHKEQTRDCLSDTCDGLPESSKQLVKCEPEGKYI